MELLDHEFLSSFQGEDKLEAVTIILTWALRFCEKAYGPVNDVEKLQRILNGTKITQKRSQSQVVERVASQKRRKKVSASVPPARDMKSRKGPTQKGKRRRLPNPKPSGSWRRGDPAVIKSGDIHPDWWYYQEWKPSRSPQPSSSRPKRKNPRKKQKAPDIEPVKQKRRVNPPMRTGRSTPRTRTVQSNVQPCLRGKVQKKKDRYAHVQSKIKFQIRQDQKHHRLSANQKKKAVQRYARNGLEQNLDEKFRLGEVLSAFASEEEKMKQKIETDLEVEDLEQPEAETTIDRILDGKEPTHPNLDQSLLSVEGNNETLNLSALPHEMIELQSKMNDLEEMFSMFSDGED